MRGTIFRSSAVPNNKQSCWVFHVLGESCTTIIYQFSFSDYNLRTFCKHPRSMQHFLVTSGSPARFAVSKGVVHFLSSLSSLLVFFSFVHGGAINYDDLKGLESLIELAIFLIKEPTSEWYTIRRNCWLNRQYL